MVKTRLFILFSFIIPILGCNEEEQIKQWLDEAGQLKIEAEKNISQAPYAKEQYQSFKGYFSKINQIPNTLSDEEKFRKPFNQFLSKNDLEALCKKVFIQKESWTALMRACTKNRFFLCAEEVRSYPAMIQAIKGFLNEENQKRFQGTTACEDLP